jgi:hypothetical protein
MTASEIAVMFRDRFPTEAEFERFCAAEALTPGAAFDAIAVTVAHQFLDGRLTYADADEIMNMVWSYALKRDDIPELMYAVYQAFDSGEYSRSEDAAGVDPVERYTRPALTKLLSDQSAV